MGPTDQIRSALTTEYVQQLLKNKAYKLASKPEFREMDQADLVQEFAIYIMEHADKYDPKRGVPDAYITCMIKSASATLIRSRGRLKRAAGYRAVSFDETYMCDSKHKIPLPEIINNTNPPTHCEEQPADSRLQAELSPDIVLALEGLTDRQRAIALLLTHSNKTAISRKLKISRRQVGNEVLAIQRHFLRLGLKK